MAAGGLAAGGGVGGVALLTVVSVVVVAGLVFFRLVLFLELFFFRFAVASEVSVSRSNTKHTVTSVGRPILPILDQFFLVEGGMLHFHRDHL